MIVTVMTKKGGTGKTSLSYNLAKDLDYYLLSNDDSIIEKIYDKAKILEELELVDVDCIYDMGGFIDKKAKKIFKNSDIIIVPTTLDANSIKRAVNTIMEINTYCKDIIIVINRVKQQTLKKYEQSIEILKGLGKEIFYLRESEIMTNSIHTGKTITELYNKNGLSKKNYKKVYEEYEKILKYIKKKGK
jgi:cellulose biosynthesis protein BcsQ